MQTNFNRFYTNFTGKMHLKLADVEDWYFMHPTPFDNIWNFYYIFLKHSEFNSLRWTLFLNLDSKFQKMFFSSTTQQRILSN